MRHPINRLLLFALLLSTGAALADENRDLARHHFHTGMAAFTLERWDEAIREFEAGYMAAPDPTFLYNIGQAHRLSNRPSLALSYYQKYLRVAPERVANRAEVEQRIDALRELLREANRSPQTVVPPSPSPSPRSPAPAAAPSPAPAPGPGPVSAASPSSVELTVVATAPSRRSRLPLVLGVVAGGVLVAGGVGVGLGLGLTGRGAAAAPLMCPDGTTHGCVDPF